MSFKFSSGRTINTYHKLLYHYRKKKRKKEKLYPDRLPFENFPSQMMYYRTTEKFDTNIFAPSRSKSSKQKWKRKKEKTRKRIRNSLDFARRGRKEGNRWWYLSETVETPWTRVQAFTIALTAGSAAISFTRNTDAITQWSSNGNSRDKPGRVSAVCMHVNFGRVG